MVVDPRLILQMLAIAEHGSISQAAAALNMSQPALSNGIAMLERRLGVRVLDRSRHGSTLTEHGKAAVRCASALKARIDGFVDEVAMRELGSTGTLKLGVTPLIGFTFVPLAIAELLKEMPGLTLSMREAPDDQLIELLVGGDTDLLICPVGTGPIRSDVTEHSLFNDPFSAVVRNGHRLSRMKSVTVASIIRERWILPHPGSAFRRQIEAIFLTCGFSVPTSSVNTNSRGMIERLLLETDRVAIMSDWAISRLDPKHFSRIALLDVGAPRTIGIKQMRNVQMAPPASNLVKILRQRARAIRAPFQDTAAIPSSSKARLARPK
jgi:DNA-binding transcriptional LysR family regulator